MAQAFRLFAHCACGSNTMSRQTDTHDRPFRQLWRGAMGSNIDTRIPGMPVCCDPRGDLRLPEETSSPNSNFDSHPAGVSVFFARNSTRADLSLGRWPATITCFFDRTAYSVPSLAFRRAGLPSCASQQKSDGHQLRVVNPYQSMERKP